MENPPDCCTVASDTASFRKNCRLPDPLALALTNTEPPALQEGELATAEMIKGWLISGIEILDWEEVQFAIIPPSPGANAEALIL